MFIFPLLLRPDRAKIFFLISVNTAIIYSCIKVRIRSIFTGNIYRKIFYICAGSAERDANYISLVDIFSAEQKHRVILEEGLMGNICMKSFLIGKVIKKRYFIIFGQSGDSIQRSQTTCATLVVGIMQNIFIQ